MVDQSQTYLLREMAEHRGLRLVASRRRKPGVGDYGKFGLTGPSGEALLGLSDNGLTASAEDIEAYLRTDALGNWKQSADATPDVLAVKRKPRPPLAAGNDRPVRRKVPGKAVVPLRTVDTKVKQPVEAPVVEAVRHRKPQPKNPPRRKRPESAPEAKLVVRAAKAGDAAAVVSMLHQLNGISITPATAVQNLDTLRRAGGGLVLAELGEPVGCCGWAVVPTMHRGVIGRITLIFVDGRHRRNGIATRMIADAVSALAKKGCALVEAMSDIEIKNAHNFFRTLAFEQTSYRFARKIVDKA